jgi:hypothetical protein
MIYGYNMVNMEVLSLFIKWLGAIQRESGERGPVSHEGATFRCCKNWSLARYLIIFVSGYFYLRR